MNRIQPTSLLALSLVAATVQASPCQIPAGHTVIPDIALRAVGAGFQHPVHIADDGTGRLYVVEQRGTIRMIENAQVLPEPFLDLRKRVESGGEKGLLGIAFHPDYKKNGLFYVNYTNRTTGLYTLVSRFKRLTDRRADPNSETVLLKIHQPYANHNGGQLAFGPDGYLYIGMGDGGWANDPHGHGQNLSSLLGALLRIDVNRRDRLLRYAVPQDNPFVGQAGRHGEIWAYGLRNPWRFSFDAGTGRLYLADVGQDEAEEIDVVKKGGNYGWNIMEGDICTPGVNEDCDGAGLEPPIHAYRHPRGFSITGGFVYRGRTIPDLCGVYLYADYVTKRIWGLRYDGKRVTAQRELLQTRHAIGSFGQDAHLELYIADHEAGTILKVVPAGEK